MNTFDGVSGKNAAVRRLTDSEIEALNGEADSALVRNKIGSVVLVMVMVACCFVLCGAFFMLPH